MHFLLSLAWRDLRGSGRSLWIFCVCLILGVSLVAATGGLYRMTSAGLLADTRALLGGDIEVESKAPLPEETLAWMRERGEVSLVRELYTMLGNTDDEFIRVELQSMMANYPLYGELQLAPDIPLSEATAQTADGWGVAIDQSLAQRHAIAVGDTVFIGTLSMVVRAIVISQPDRNLTADWRGAPVLIADGAIEAAGLSGFGSRIDYDYKVATTIPAQQWQEEFYERFLDLDWEVKTFEDRSERVAERLGQIASGLLIIAFSTLFVGGLGVFSSIRLHLQTKLKTIATLRALGLRNQRLATVYLAQIGILSGGASLVGCLLGGLLAWSGALVVAREMDLDVVFAALTLPLCVAFLFGLLTAYTFALPALGQSLNVPPAALFRGSLAKASLAPNQYIASTVIIAGLLLVGIILSLPDPLFALGFVGVLFLLLGMLEILLRGLRLWARRLDRGIFTRNNFPLRMALANLQRPESPLRSALLSLGSALTILVACTLVVISLVRTVYSTIPEEAPALVLYDIDYSLVDQVITATRKAEPEARIETAPLVRARLEAMRGTPVGELLAESEYRLDKEFREAINNEHKLSYRGGNIDGLTLVDGSWWEEDASHVMSLEDREARRLGINVGDRIRYQISGTTLDLEVRAIHKQKGVQTRFWFEGIVANNLLEGLDFNHVGTVFMPDSSTVEAQRQIAGVAPNVVSVRTERLLSTARDLLGQATQGLVLLAVVSLGASLLVLVSVIAAGRNRQIYEATILNTLGARLSLVHRALLLEFTLLAGVTAVFAVLLGAAIALPLLEWRMKLPSSDLLWVAILTACTVSVAVLGFSARYVYRRLKLAPAILLRDSG